METAHRSLNIEIIETLKIFYHFVSTEKNKFIVSLTHFPLFEMLTCNIDWINTMMCGNETRRCPIILVNNDNVGEFVSCAAAEETVNRGLKKCILSFLMLSFESIKVDFLFERVSSLCSFS